MRHTFQLAFVNHLGIKRKYMFSMTDGLLRDNWLECLRVGVDAALVATATPSLLSRAHQVANAVALQVLRDTLIVPDDALPQHGLNAVASTPASRNGRNNSPINQRPVHVRSNSFSRTYATGIGKAEVDLLGQDVNRLQHPSMSGRRPSGNLNPLTVRRSSKDDSAEHALLARSTTGHEVVTVTCQNSHLPAVLGLLNAHVDVSRHPLAGIGTVRSAQRAV